MEEEYDFTTSYLVNPPNFENYYIEKTNTYLEIKKSLTKEIETWGGVGHKNINNDGGSMKKRSRKATFLEESKQYELTDSTNISDLKIINKDAEYIKIESEVDTYPE